MEKVNLPKVDELTEDDINQICLWYDHSFGLTQTEEYKNQANTLISSGYTKKEQEELKFHVKEIYHAIYKELVNKYKINANIS